MIFLLAGFVSSEKYLYCVGCKWYFSPEKHFNIYRISVILAYVNELVFQEVLNRNNGQKFIYRNKFRSERDDHEHVSRFHFSTYVLHSRTGFQQFLLMIQLQTKLTINMFPRRVKVSRFLKSTLYHDGNLKLFKVYKRKLRKIFFSRLTANFVKTTKQIWTYHVCEKPYVLAKTAYDLQ